MPVVDRVERSAKDGHRVLMGKRKRREFRLVVAPPPFLLFLPILSSRLKTVIFCTFFSGFAIHGDILLALVAIAGFREIDVTACRRLNGSLEVIDIRTAFL